MPKCVKTIYVDAMHLFEIHYNVAAPLNLVYKSCRAVWGPILSLKMPLLMKLMLEEWSCPQNIVV